MGIDPGTCTMGYGLIKETSTKIYVLQYGTLKLNCYPSQTLKLQHIFKETLQILQEYKPDEIAIEAPFYGLCPIFFAFGRILALVNMAYSYS